MIEKLTICATIVMSLGCGCRSSEPDEMTVKDYYHDDFLIGAAIPARHVNGKDPKADSVVSLHFNSIVAENCMKQEEIQPEEGVFVWEDADKFVEYGDELGMAIIGHALIWHSQLAPWFTRDSVGNPVSPDVLKERMKTHISTLMGRYKGRVKGWDVVNEAILDDGSYRHSPFYEILGEEFIPLAFEYAHEADPDAELYINDYSMFLPEKREAYVKLIGELQERGVRIDGVGMQSHIGMDYPELEEYEKSIEALSATGVNVMITELDMSALPTVMKGANISDKAEFESRFNPYTAGLPADVSERWNERMDSVMSILEKHSDVISRVTWWGTQDGMSWKNNFPMRGRTDYPLLFDRNCDIKPFMAKRLQEKRKQKKE